MKAFALALTTAAALLVLTACAGNARARSPEHSAASAVSSPALTGLELRTAMAECSADIEVGTANGHDYSHDQPRSADLPVPCRPLNLDQLTSAVAAAVKDMQQSG